MLHGRAGRVLKYEAGVFRHSDALDVPIDGPRYGMLAGRVTILPVKGHKDSVTRNLEFGASFARNTLPEGLLGVTGESVSGENFFDSVYVNGARTRLGAHSLWEGGRVTLKGEVLQLSDERRGQAITGDDLSNLIVRGGYVTGIVHVYGKHRQKGPSVDAAARFDRVSFGSANQTDDAFTNPRADHVAPLSQHTLTFGATFIVNRYLKVQGNVIREALIDPLGVRDLAAVAPWTGLVRLQFGL
jgi:hypothetical protein